MEKIINKLIDEFTKGVDTYSHNGSTWLIFTESKQWVIELTDSKTLWYNYNFFKGMFNYVSMNVVENQQYITKWVEDNIINKVKHTVTANNHIFDRVEDAIQDGVKHTARNNACADWEIEDTIQNGVKETIELMNELPNRVKKIIKKGVKETNHVDVMKFFDNKMDDAIENGVRHTEKSLQIDGSCVIEDTVQNGIKETCLEMNITEGEVDDIIQDGVKLTQYNDNENKSWVEGVIKKGIKETNHVDVMGFFNNKMEDALQNGVRHTLNTEYMPKTMVEDIIENGVKETKGHGFEQQNIIDDIVKDGVKEIKTPNKDGDIVPFAEWMKENNSSSYTKMIDDVIDNGVKKTMLRQHITDGNVETIIETGIKEVQPLPEQSGELIGYGNYYHGKEDRTKAFIDYIEETIKFGVKET